MWLTIGQSIPILVTDILWAGGTSPGKRVMRLKIVDADSHAPMTRRQAALRTVGYLLTFAMLGIGFVWIVFNPRRQALHDRIAGTVDRGT